MPSRLQAGGRLLALALAHLVLVRLLGGEQGTLVTLLVGLLPLVLLAAWPLLALAAALRDRLLAAGAAVLVLVQGALLAPTLRAAEPAPGGTPLRVVAANLYVLNPDPLAAARVLRDLRPDVLVVSELDGRGRAALEAAGLLDDLPHQLLGGGEAVLETVGLYSRTPLEAPVVRQTAARTLPRATVAVGAVDVRVLATHALPPVGPLQPLWRASIAELANEVDDEPGAVVVAGDLNADRDHRVFRRLLGSGLRDASDELGRGPVRTWPAGLPLLHLDHVMVRDGADGRVAVRGVREVRLPGSDHLAVVADLAVLP